MSAVASPAIAAADLLADRRALAETVASVAHAVGTDRADIGASLLCEAWTWTLAAYAIGGLVRDRRVPDVAPENIILLPRADGAPDGARLAAPRYASRSGGPRERPGDAALATDDELIAWTLGRLTAHLAPLVDELHAIGRRSRAALWRGAGDRVLHAFVWAGETFDRRAEAWALGERCAALGGAWPGPPRYRLLPHADGEHPTRTRNGCCLHWRGAERHRCFTCPLTCDDERVARLQGQA